MVERESECPFELLGRPVFTYMFASAQGTNKRKRNERPTEMNVLD